MSINRKKWFKIIGLICLTPILLVLLIVILLYMPFVQDFAARKASQYASESLGVQIDIARIRLGFPLNLKAQGVSVTSLDGDTLLFVNSFELDLRSRPLLNKELSVRKLKLSEIKVNTRSIIEGIGIDGLIGGLDIQSDRISLIDEEIVLNHLKLSDTDLKIQIDSISSSDSSQSTNNWKFLLNAIQIQHLTFALQMPADSLQLVSYFENISLTDGQVDLGSGQYDAEQFLLSKSEIKYDIGNLPVKPGLDLSHITLCDVNFSLDSLFYQGKEVRGFIRSFSASEQSGLAIVSMEGNIQNDEKELLIPQWSLQTPYSSVNAQLTLPWETLSSQPQGILYAQLTASVDKRDIEFATGELLKNTEDMHQDSLLVLSCRLEGNLNKLHLNEFKSELPGILHINAYGTMEKVADSISRSGEFNLTAFTQGKNLSKSLLPKEYAGRFSLPDSMRLNIQAALEKGKYSAEIQMNEKQGRMQLSGRYNSFQNEYFVDVKVDSIVPIHFLPKDSILLLTASLRAEGKGTNIYANSTWSQITGALSEIQYKNTVLSDLSFDGSFKNHQIQGNIVSEYPFVKGNLTLDGSLYKEKLAGILILDMDSLDLYRMKVTEKPFTNSFQIFTEFNTDFGKNHQLDVTLGNWAMTVGEQKVKPKTLTLRAKGNEDTTLVSFHTGDLGITFTGNADFETITNKLTALADDLGKQMKRDSMVDFQQIRPLYPEFSLKVNAQRDNPIYNYLQESNIFFDRLALNMSASPEKGLQADALLFSLIKDTTKIDTVQLNLWQDTLGLQYIGNVVKNKFRNQESFKAGLKGGIQYGSADIEMYYRNGRGDTGLWLGIEVKKELDGLNIQLFPENPILAFLPFKLNKDNYVRIKNRNDISANLRLVGEKNASLWLHSSEENGRMEELSVELNQINLERISKEVLNLPSLQGVVNASLRYVPIDKTYMLVADANVDNLIYQGGTVGELLLNGVYLPLENEEHQLDIHFFRNQKEISTLSALYQSKKNGYLNGSVEVNQLPLMMINPFLMGTMRLNGALQGAMTISGTASKPLLNGALQMDTASMYIVSAGSKFLFDKQEVRIKDSKLQFNKYNIYSADSNPFMINGVVDMSDPAKGFADLKLTANNMQLFNSKKNNESIVYGKLVVNLSSTVKGPLNSLAMRGNLHLLGNTNMTYIMKESPLTAQDRMADLVTFSYFQDTIPRRSRRNLSGVRRTSEYTPVGGFDMLLTLGIDPAVKIKIDLDEEESNRIELEGGGDLSFQYTPQGDMLLTGRYMLSGGLIKYNMPVIGNKTLKIKENSYIDWSGNPMDPSLNLKATERIRSYISSDGQTSHAVNFDAGVELKQRMENLSLQFTLEALDDATIQSQLKALGTEERSKRAVGLLLTGMYLNDDGSGKIKLDMGTALSSFLQSEINNITGSLLKGVDINFGMENYDGMGDGTGTNYSFRFSKRFYNDRLNVVLGGLVSTGNVPNDNNTFINDASIEYRLDTGGSRYAKLFYNRQYESLLEGEITKYGAGIVFRRKMRRLNELFIFRKKNTEIDKESVDEK